MSGSVTRDKKKVGNQLNDNIVTWLQENFTVSNDGRIECSVVLGTARLVFKECTDRAIGRAIRKSFPSVLRNRSNSTYYYKHLVWKQHIKDIDEKGKRTNISSLEFCQLKKSLLCYLDVHHSIQGDSSRVCFATYEKILVAVKEFKEGTTLQTIKKELNALLVLGPHECLPVLLGVCFENEPYSIVYKLYGFYNSPLSKSLAILFNTVPDKIPSHLWIPFVIKLANSVDHIHKKGFVHGALNTDHILVNKFKGELYPKFVGLGNSLQIEDSPNVQDMELIALGKVIKKICDRFENQDIEVNKIIEMLTDPLNIPRPSAGYIAEKFKDLLDAAQFD